MEFFASYTGPDFLAFYAAMLATSVIAGFWIPANLRPAGRRGEITDAGEIAVLAGGSARHADAVTADLLARGALTAASKGKVRTAQTDVETGSAGRSLLRKVGEFDLREIRISTAADASSIKERLIRQGLLMEPGERTKLQILSALPFAALLVIGMYRQQAGAAAGEPTDMLILLMVVTGLFALIRLFKGNPRTTGGIEVLRAAEANAARMRSAPTANEAGFAVALFGTAVLVGTPWEPVHAMRQSAGGDGSYGDDGGDGSDGGGCGGGCGGCGG